MVPVETEEETTTKPDTTRKPPKRRTGPPPKKPRSSTPRKSSGPIDRSMTARATRKLRALKLRHDKAIAKVAKTQAFADAILEKIREQETRVAGVITELQAFLAEQEHARTPTIA